MNVVPPNVEPPNEPLIVQRLEIEPLVGVEPLSVAPIASPDDASVEEMRLRARQMMLELKRLLEQLEQLTGSMER